MRRLIRATALSAVLAVGVGVANVQALSVDFVALAAGNEGAFTGTVVSGVSITGSASPGGAVAYLDDLSGGKPGGLGVCKVLTLSGDCTPSSDDNVTSGEILGLKFSERVVITDITFRNGNHDQSFNLGSMVDIGSNENPIASVQLAAAYSTLPAGLFGTDFTFGNSNAGSASGDQFYISTITFLKAPPGGPNPIPLPAPLLMLLSSLLALGGYRWWRRRGIQAQA